MNVLVCLLFVIKTNCYSKLFGLLSKTSKRDCVRSQKSWNIKNRNIKKWPTLTLKIDCLIWLKKKVKEWQAMCTRADDRAYGVDLGLQECAWATDLQRLV